MADGEVETPLLADGESKKPPTKSSKLSKVRSYFRSRKTEDNTFVVGLLAAITSFLTLALIVALTVWNAVIIFDTDSPSLFRTVFLCFEGVFAASMLSIYFDRPNYELFDFGTALIVFLVKLIPFLAVPLVLEILRVMSCPTGGGSTLYFTICNSYASESSIALWFFIAISALSLVNFILLGAWFYQFRGREKSASATGGSKVAKEIAKNASKAHHVGIGIIAAIVLLVVAFVLVVALFKASGDYALWHYHGGFLVLPATYAGAELAFFFTTPPSWAILCLVLGALSLASLTLGLIKEIPRFFHCALGTVAPSPLDNDICVNEGWRAYLVPSAMTLIAILLLVSFILMIVRVVRDNAATKTQKD